MMKYKLFIVTLFLTTTFFVKAQTVAVSTNLVSLSSGGTLNAEASLGVARHWSIQADAAYNPYAPQFRQRAFSLGARYWPWHIYSGWWLSSRVKYQEFNARSEQIRQGDRYGGSLYGGYSKLLGKHLNMDVGFGLWAGYETYVVYACQNCGRFIESGQKTFLLPDQMLVSLTYVF